MHDWGLDDVGSPCEGYILHIAVRDKPDLHACTAEIRSISSGHYGPNPAKTADNALQRSRRIDSSFWGGEAGGVA